MEYIRYYEDRNRRVRKDESVSYALWAVANGTSFLFDSDESLFVEDREQFVSEFPEYSSMSYETLKALSKDERDEIVGWYYSSWYETLVYAADPDECDSLGYLKEEVLMHLSLDVDEIVPSWAV